MGTQVFLPFSIFFIPKQRKREKQRERERKRNREMSRIPSIRSLQSLFLFCLISLQFISGLSLSLLILFQCLNFTILFKHIYFLFVYDKKDKTVQELKTKEHREQWVLLCCSVQESLSWVSDQLLLALRWPIVFGFSWNEQKKQGMHG